MVWLALRNSESGTWVQEEAQGDMRWDRGAGREDRWEGGHENEAQEEEGHAPSSVDPTIIDTPPRADLVQEARDELEVLGKG
jgi:hypothetical protein